MATAVVTTLLATGCERAAEGLLRRIVADRDGEAMVFPRTGEGLRSRAAELPDPSAPPCRWLGPDTAQWPVSVMRTQQLPGIRWITMRTPMEWQRVLEPPQPGVRAPLGVWVRTDFDNTAAARERGRLELRAGGAALYPLVTLPLGSRQLHMNECRVAVESDTLRIAKFTVLRLDGSTTHHVVGFRTVGGNAAITATGVAGDSVALDRIAAALRTTRLFR
jgi:hypothetical protein